MPRRHRFCPAGYPAHIVQRGNNRQVCFVSDSDLKAYANWLYEACEKFGVNIHAWVFMTNHVHLLATPNTDVSLSRCMQFLGRHYVRYFNYRYNRSGTLYEGRFKSSVIQSKKYFLACQRYIEMNPVRAGMVNDPVEYAWSSYKAHAFGHKAKIWQPHPEYLALGDTERSRMSAYHQLFAHQQPENVVKNVRKALNSGLALGNKRFKKHIEKLSGGHK